jgi:Rapamycin-insensitive companion of mTOR, N-term/Rapamycin-insensitive companion of mTOR, domain 5/Rapamycin-insensitive companion of mTOR RasGEF_N domain/Rapamycin-insensitive companion of mTOR, middle domain
MFVFLTCTLIPTGIEEIKSSLNAISENLWEDQKARVVSQALLQIVDLTKLAPSFRDLTSIDALMKAVRYVVATKDRTLRSQAYRALRYMMRDEDTVADMLKVRMDILVARSLERDNKYMWERMQALKLIRAIMEVAPARMPRSLVQALVSVADAAKDEFRRVCLDTLRELALVNPNIVAACNGIRSMVEAILDAECQDVAGSLTLTLLFLLDQQSTRKFIHVETDLQRLFSVFTDMDGTTSRTKEASRAAAHKALITIMRSWTGILCLTSDRGGLSSLVRTLQLPPSVSGVSWAKEAIFELFFEILHVVRSSDLRIVYARDSVAGPPSSNLLHNYIVMVLFAFLECGLVEVLTSLATSTDAEFSGVAQNLLVEILRLSADLFPRSMCADLNSLTEVVSSATAFHNDEFLRFRATNMIIDMHVSSVSTADPNGLVMASAPASALSPDTKTSDKPHHLVSVSHALERMQRGRNPLLWQQIQRRREDPHREGVVHGIDVEAFALEYDPSSIYQFYNNVIEQQYGVGSALSGTSGGLFRPSHSRATHVTYSNTVLQRLRFEMDSQVDENDLQSMFKASGVVVGKDYLAWDFELCLRLLEGPLRTPHGLSIALNTKFIKRLLSFLRPEKKTFCNLEWVPANMIYAQVACQLFHVLVESQQGSEYQHFVSLVDDLIKAMLRECGKLDDGKQQSGSIDAASRPFSRHNTATCMSREYFALLGIVSAYPRGDNFFAMHNFYQDMYLLCTDHSRDYMTRNLLASFDYSGNSKLRTLIETWAKNGSTSVRRFAVSHMRLLLRRNVPDIWKWGVNLLIAQLQFEDRHVALAALNVLEEACVDDPMCLDTLINTLSKKHDCFDHVGSYANNLQLLLLSRPTGVEVLRKTGWIDRQLKAWGSSGMVCYVEALESALVSSLNSVGSSAALSIAPSNESDSSGSSNGNISAQEETGAGSSPADSNESKSKSKSLSEQVNRMSADAVGYTGPFGGFGGFRNLNSAQRSKADDYYLDRIHNLPWNVELELVHPKGRAIIHLITEAVVHTVPKDSDEEGYKTYVVATVLNVGNSPDPYRVDPVVTVRTRLTVGAVSAQESAYIQCTPEARQALSPSNTSVHMDGTIWNFEYRHADGAAVGARGSVSTSSAAAYHMRTPSSRFRRTHDRSNGPELLLQSIWFEIPTPNTFMPSVSLAPHLYGEMCKTRAGALLLQNSGKITEAISIVRTIAQLDGGQEDADTKIADQKHIDPKLPTSATASPPSPQLQRAALWAIGQIGSSQHGFGLLSPSAIVEFISDQARCCSTLSMRGTCFYVLGLLSRTAVGRKRLSQLGWEVSRHPQSGVIVPRDFETFMRMPSSHSTGSWAADPTNQVGLAYVPLKSKLPGDNEPDSRALVILGHISNLSNNVTQKSSLQTLRQMRADTRLQHYFSSPAMLYETLKLLNAYTFRLPARRFIMFDLLGRAQFDRKTINYFDTDFQTTDTQRLKGIDQQQK